MLDSSSDVVLTTCLWQNQKTIAKLHTISGWIILNSIKYKECLWVKCISFILAPFWNIIWFKKHKFKHFNHPWSCQPTHTKTKKKSTMSIFARFFFINILFCSVKKNISILFIEFKRLSRLNMFSMKTFHQILNIYWISKSNPN